MAAATKPVQLTKGFEEEVYTGTSDGKIVGVSQMVAAELPGFYTEPDARNVEFTTEPDRDYDTVASLLMSKRCRLRRYLRENCDLTLIPGSTLSLGNAKDFHLSNRENPYYVYIRDTYGTDVVTASSHLNVGVEDPEILLRAYRILRCEASMFLALTAASPFLGGEVTGFHSTRWHVFPKTPQSVPLFAGHAEFAAWMEHQLASRAMYNPRHLWLSVRPNGEATPQQLNRVEVRICDRISCPYLLQGVTAMIEGRVWEALGDPELDPLSIAGSDELAAMSLRNEEETARQSLEAKVTDWRSGRELWVKDWLGERLDALAPTALAHGFDSHLDVVRGRLESGSTAQRWLREISRGKTPDRVIAEAVEEMAEDDKAVMGAECA